MWVGQDLEGQRVLASYAVAPLTQSYPLGWRSCMRDQMIESCQDFHELAVESQCVTSQNLMMTPQENALCGLAAVSSGRYSDCQA